MKEIVDEINPSMLITPLNTTSIISLVEGNKHFTPTSTIPLVEELQILSIEVLVSPGGEPSTKMASHVLSNTQDLNESQNSFPDGSIQSEAQLDKERTGSHDVPKVKDEEEDENNRPLKWKVQRKMVQSSKEKENVTDERQRENPIPYLTWRTSQKLMADPKQPSKTKIEENQRRRRYSIGDEDLVPNVDMILKK
ncbi:hypothetical protein H5410_051165 [Solanum commersonii]|uniref:Uncharacterized protein n=1 Tax=Solanum commersonii TaxID=4109 RepID=A0A9J5WXN9_SOLCO|nr:hypothetical protein H5410_051165 [Solanum commersonii]